MGWDLIIAKPRRWVPGKPGAWQGIIKIAWPDYLTVWECYHLHPTPREAERCAANVIEAFYKRVREASL